MNSRTQSGESRSQLSPLKQALLALEEAQSRIRELEGAVAEPIAVVGVGCRIPGGESGPDSYWRLLHDRKCAVGSEVDRRLAPAVGAQSVAEYARWAALLDQVDCFDPLHFGISPREAVGMDPQQRLLLEVSWEALENAGIDSSSLYRTATGVFVGISSHDYAQLRLRGYGSNAIDSHFASGIAPSVAAGRIAYVLGLSGPTLSVDTACSSSLVAVHLACEALRRRECTTALAGGVNVILAAEPFIAFAQAGMLSASGKVRAFDGDADGFVRGEGCGMVVLKRLEDAETAGDRIAGVILGSAMNQDGASSGLTVPNGLAQEALLREAHRRAGIEPWQVGYVEAHGTGTALGDPIEARALGAVFGRRERKLAIGSVKTNIGHLEAAAGVAGLIKVVLGLEHGLIPPQLYWTRPSEHVQWEELGLDVVTETRTWEPVKGRRIGGVSSFGFSGTNAHVIVEGITAQNKVNTENPHEEVLVLAARTESALLALAHKYADFLQTTILPWNAICCTAGSGRTHFDERLAIVAKGSTDAGAQLTAWLQGIPMNTIYRGCVRRSSRATVSLVPSAPAAEVAARFVQGASVNWCWAGESRLRPVSLPTYAFQRDRFWIESRPRVDSAVALQPEGPDSLDSVKAPELRILLANLPPDQRLATIREYLRQEIAGVLQLGSRADLREDQLLTEIGLDSLMALKLKNHLQQSSGVTLPANLLFECTVTEIAAFLNTLIADAGNQPPRVGYEEISL